MLIFIIIPVQSYLLKIKDGYPYIPSRDAALRFDITISQLKAENWQPSFCPYFRPECWSYRFNTKTQQFEPQQLYLEQLQIEDQMEILKFMLIPELDEITNKIALSSFQTDMNSFVYFGYSLCVSINDGYFEKGFNYIDSTNMEGIKLQLHEIIFDDTYQMAFRLNYLEIFDQIIDISQYDIIFNQDIYHSLYPIEIFDKIKIRIRHPDIDYHQLSDNDFYFFDRVTLGRNNKLDERLNPIKFYNNNDDYQLIIKPNEYVCYQCYDDDLDIFYFFAEEQKIIILGNQFLLNKLFHVNFQTKTMIIQNLETSTCVEPESNISLSNFKYSIVLIIVITITFYFIIRQLRYKKLVEKAKTDFRFYKMRDNADYQEQYHLN